MKIFITIFLLLCFLSCESSVIFEEPQPSQVVDELQIRPIYQGDYLCTSDSSLLKIRDRHIYVENGFSLFDTIDGIGLDTLIREIDIPMDTDVQKVYVLEGEPLPLENVTMNEEVFVGRLIHRDTIFSIEARDHRLRYFRGYLVLNYRRHLGNWEVFLLGLETNGDLRLFAANTPEDLDAVSIITPVKEQFNFLNNEEQYLLRPTKEEFRKLVNKKLVFNECEYYERIPTYEWIDLPN